MTGTTGASPGATTANPSQPEETQDAGRGVLWSLLFGNFVIGSGVMVVAGTLNDISQSMQVSIATAGQLITAAGATIALGAPLCAAVVAGWDRRRLLALSMLLYGLMHLVCMLFTSFGVLLPVRALSVLPAAVFTPQAAACVSLLVPPAQRGRAITFVFLGWSVASVAGLPLGAFIGGTFGWRAAFATIAALSFVSAAWVWQAMPNGVRPPALSWAAWRETLQSPALMLCILVTVLFAAGQFTLFSYLAPYYKAQLAMTPGQISLMFAWFGAFGLLGNLVMSRNIDRIGAANSVMLAVACMAASMLLWPLGTTLLLAALVVTFWGLGCFASNSAQQARLVGIAPALAAASVALNSSAMYAGQAIGAASGGWLIAAGRMEMLHWAGFAGLLAAMLVSWLATRARVHGT